MTTTIPSLHQAAAPRKITLLMLLCGLVLSGTIGAAASAADRDVPHLTVRYSGQSLATDEGARSVYRRIVKAAENVCPLQSGSPFVTEGIEACRKEAVARAVRDIGNTRLAALHASSATRG